MDEFFGQLNRRLFRILGSRWLLNISDAVGSFGGALILAMTLTAASYTDLTWLLVFTGVTLMLPGLWRLGRLLCQRRWREELRRQS